MGALLDPPDLDRVNCSSYTHHVINSKHIYRQCTAYPYIPPFLSVCSFAKFHLLSIIDFLGASSNCWCTAYFSLQLFCFEILFFFVKFLAELLLTAKSRLFLVVTLNCRLENLYTIYSIGQGF